MKACVLVCVVLCAQTAVSSPVTTAIQTQGFLVRFGYLSSENKTHSPAEVASALRKFQWFSGLRVTGCLDTETLKKMKCIRQAHRGPRGYGQKDDEDCGGFRGSRGRGGFRCSREGYGGGGKGGGYKMEEREERRGRPY